VRHVRTTIESVPTQLLGAFPFLFKQFRNRSQYSLLQSFTHLFSSILVQPPPFLIHRYSDFYEWTQALLEQQPGVKRQPLAPELALAVNEAKGARCGSAEYSTDHFRKVGGALDRVSLGLMLID